MNTNKIPYCTTKSTIGYNNIKIDFNLLLLNANLIQSKNIT